MSAKIIVPDKHLLHTSQNDMQQICKPLAVYFNITYFEYLRVYKNGPRAALSTNSLKVKHILETEDTNVSHDFSFITNSLNYYLWQDMCNFLPKQSRISLDKQISFIRNSMDIDNGITLVENHTNYVEFFQFGSTAQNSSIIDFYLQNLDVLKSFILYFKDKASKLISLCDNNKIVMPKIFIPNQTPLVKSTKRGKAKDQYLKAIEHNRYFFDKDLANIYLTKRELECLALLARGKTAKETAKLLQLSPRTVETFINNIKIKLECQTFAEVIKIYWESNLKFVIPMEASI